MTKNKILSIRLKPEEWQEFINVADDCGLNPNTHGFQKDAVMEFMKRSRDYTQELKETIGSLTIAKRNMLRSLINKEDLRENLYNKRSKK